MKYLFLAISLFSFGAQADYFKAGLGYNLGGKVKFDTPIGDTDVDLDTAFPSPILVAYGFEMVGDVAGEIELSYRKTEYDDVTNSVEPTALMGAFNVAGSVPLGAVSLAGGAGVTFGSFDDFATGLDSGTAFGIQLFGGLDFNLSEQFALGAEFRYFTTVSKIDLGNSIDGSYENTSLLITGKFMM